MAQDTQLSEIEGWIGDLESYQIEDGQLNLKAKDEGGVGLSKAVFFGDTCEWRTSFTYKFSPSTSNFFRIYFIANQEVTQEVTEGLFIEVGESGSQDGANLYQMFNGKKYLIKKLFPGSYAQSDVVHDLMLVRCGADFQIFMDGEDVFDFVLNVEDTLPLHGYIGIENQVTKSNVSGFGVHYFNFGLHTTSSLAINKVDVNQELNELTVHFNEGLSGLVLAAVEVPSLEVLDYQVKSSSSVVIKYDQKINHEALFDVNLWFELKDSSLMKLENNFWVYHVNSFDLIFNEVMYDHASSTGYLKAGQYVELFNRSDHPIDLEKIVLLVGDEFVDLPPFELSSKHYVVLMEDSMLHDEYNQVLMIPQWKNLPQSKGVLGLMCKEVLIDQLSYDKVFFEDNFKRNGGWAIELESPDYHCCLSEGWRFAENTIGGTPGYVNSLLSVNEKEDLKLEQVCFVNDSQIMLDYNIKLPLLYFDTEDFNVELELQTVMRDSDHLNRMVLTFDEKMIHGKVYDLEVKAVSACHSFTKKEDVICHFGIPQIPDKGDVIVNEILSEAMVTVGDFIEVYNLSNKIVDLSELLIGEFDESEKLMDVYEISKKKALLLPKDYLCLTKDESEVTNSYFLNDAAGANLLELPSIPSLSAEGGHVGVVNRSGTVIDLVHYEASWHSDLLGSTKGVSLERIYFSAGSSDPKNWASGVFDTGYATPGVKNANVRNEGTKSISQGELYLVSSFVNVKEALGNHMLKVAYDTGVQGYALTGYLYDAYGVKMGLLCEHLALGSSGELGFDLGELSGWNLKPSVYIIHAEAIHSSKKKIVLRKTVSVN